MQICHEPAYLWTGNAPYHRHSLLTNVMARVLPPYYWWNAMAAPFCMNVVSMRVAFNLVYRDLNSKVLMCLSSGLLLKILMIPWPVIRLTILIHRRSNVCVGHALS